MKFLADLTQRSFRPNLVRVPVVFALIIASVVSIWFVVVPRAQAAPCDVCHKRVDTLSVVCFGSDYRRHKDHGDTDGPCPPTASQAFLKPAHKIKPAAPTRD